MAKNRMSTLTLSLEHSQHVVFFVDLLGTEAAVYGNPQRLSELTKLLKDLKRGEGEFKIHSELASKNSVAAADPAISTFSDHVVISFNLDALRKETESPYRAVISTSKLLIGGLAYRAFAAGFLIRGGATLDSLFHEQGVVAGKGLIEAYRLERSTIYPRIAVSPKLYQALPAHTISPIHEDRYGVKHFDYMEQMLLHAGGLGGGAARQKWYDSACRLATENIENFKETGDANRMEKWGWFLDKLQTTRSTMESFFK